MISDKAYALLKARIAGSTTLTAEKIAARLVGAMADEGHAILAEGIAEKPADVDLVEIHGYGFPRHKGADVRQRRLTSFTKVLLYASNPFFDMRQLVAERQLD
nr:hypothetical protein [Marinicella sp. W31]MDC2878534.1 hypothetical protein [Marinicella sp. W31]